MAATREVRQARVDATAWNVLSLKLHDVTTALTESIGHCARNDMPPGPRLVEVREEFYALQSRCKLEQRKACERADQLERSS